MGSNYRFSPFGEAIHPWINKADTKFNKNHYHVKLACGGPEALALKEAIELEAKEGFERFWETEQGKKIPLKERKTWSVYFPFEVETDDTGDTPTGYIVFDFKQNAQLKLKEGTTKEVTIGIVDAKNKPVTAPIFGGSVLRTMFTTRDVVVVSNKKAGVRLDFAKVQIRSLGQGASGGGGSFSEDEGGYEVESERLPSDHTGNGSSADTQGDY